MEDTIQINFRLYSIMEYMEFSDSDPYDIPIGDLLGSEGEGGSAEVKPQEDVDVGEKKVTKEKEKGKKIIMRRRVKVRTDAVREDGKSHAGVNEKWSRMIEEQNVNWSKMIDEEQKKGVRKRKASNKEENEYWEGPDEKEETEEKAEKEEKEEKVEEEEKEEKEEDGKKLFEIRKRNFQICQKDCQVKMFEIHRDH